MHSDSIFRRSAAGLFALGLLTAAFTAQAQDTAGQNRQMINSADPLDAQAPVPATRYVSALDAYRKGGDYKSVPWQEANQTVTRIGGWRTYAREAQQPEAVSAQPAPAPQSPGTHKMPSHGAHHKH